VVWEETESAPAMLFAATEKFEASGHSSEVQIPEEAGL
jgi:hypothetical protein